uniref:Uncharacterized protein n=1 Tax=Chelonoidis abingdonii TaxID=106734 RepID=A0A8C0IKE1_CHEAB
PSSFVSDLEPKCQGQLQHQKMHAQHHGHESMRMEMVLILIATLVVAQIVLVKWKQRHCRSYNVSNQPKDCCFRAIAPQNISSFSCKDLKYIQERRQGFWRPRQN